MTVTSNWSDEGKYDANFYSEIASKYENGYKTAETALEIGTAAQLAAFAKFVNDGKNFSDKFVCLTADIDLQGTAPTVDYQNDGDSGFKVVLSGAISNNWVPIGKNYDNPFKGTFDGKNCSVLGMVIRNGYGGLFGLADGATIQNVGVKSVIIAGDDAGKIAGYLRNNSTIQNCYATGPVYVRTSGHIGVGGIVGHGDCSGLVKNCYNSGDIFAMTTFSSSGIDCGGICGNNCSVDNCFSTGMPYAYSSTGRPCKVGGILGFANSGTLSNVYYDKDAAPGISAYGINYGLTIDTETVKELSADELEKKVTEMGDENGEKLWFADPEVRTLKTPKSSDFVFTLPDDLDYDGKGKVISIVPKTGITGMGAVTVKYYKVNANGTLGAASTTPPTDAGRYKVKFDVAAGTEYYAATDLPAMF